MDAPRAQSSATPIEVASLAGAPEVPDESALVARLRAGEGAAYEEVINDLGGRLLATARRMLGNDDDAQEAVQDAFLSAFRNMGKFDEKSRLSTWLHRIVINASLMKLRTKRRRPAGSLEDVYRSDNGHSELPIASWRERAPDEISDEVRTTLQDEIEHLPDEYRTVIMLRDIEELDTQETAVVLGISESAVKTRLHRARLALRQRLDAYMRGGAS